MSGSFSWAEAIAELERRREQALEMGGPPQIARQRSRGKQTVRERIDQLVDPGSFYEVGSLAMYEPLDPMNNPLPKVPSSYVCGLAEVDGRPVALGANDFTVAGGSSPVYLDRSKGEVGGFIDDLAHEFKIPILLLMEGVGGGMERAQVAGHGIIPNSSIPANPTASYARPFQLMTEIPCLTAILGPAAGLAAGRAMLSHFTVMTKDTAALFLGGPPVVKRALGIDIDKFELGGAQLHTRITGAVDNVAEDETDALSQIKRVLGYLPQNAWELPPVMPGEDPVDRRCDEVLQIMPENPRRAYDPRRIIASIFDRDSFFEVGRDWGRAVIQGFARIGGRPLGVFASNPAHLGGALDGPACDKQSRFMDLCDLFHLPIVYFVDNPGFMIGPDAERQGVTKAAMRAIQSVQYARVPMVTVHIRKAYAMGPMAAYSPAGLGLRLAWPSAQWGDFPAEGGVDAVFRRMIESAEDPDAFRRKAEELLNRYTSPWGTAEAFGVEEMIHPAETREYIARFIAAGWNSMRTALGQPGYRGRI